MDDSLPELGDLEREVMQLVWAHGPLTAEAGREKLSRPLKESTVRTVLRLLPELEPMSFRALVAGVPHRLELVVRFLAVLELYKQGVVDLVQFTNFGELLVRRLTLGEVALDAASLDDWGDTADEGLPEEAMR